MYPLPKESLAMTFTHWLETHLTEKGIDPETPIVVDGPSGPNHMTVATVTAAMRFAPAAEKKAIKTTLVKIDFANGDPLHFLTHLAHALAI